MVQRVEREASVAVNRAQTRAARRERGIAARAARRVQWRRWAVLLAAWQAVSWLGAVVLTTLVGFEVVKLGFFAVLVSVACLPLFTRVLARPGWLLDRQLRAGDEAALATGHLPPRLGRLAEETRVLRLALEAAPDGAPAVHDWVWVWVQGVRDLGPQDREVLERLGLSHRDVEGALLGEALLDREAGEAQVAKALRAAREGLDGAAQQRRLELITEQLEAFEISLLRYDPDPYR